MKIYTSATIDEGHPTERTFRIVRHRDRGGWEVQGNRGELGWESRQTFYSRAAAIRAMVEWAEDERLASAKRRGEKAA
jgi:hypothetical protein